MNETPLPNDENSQSSHVEHVLLEAESVVAEAYAAIIHERQEREFEKAKRDQPLAQLVPFKSPSRVAIVFSATQDFAQRIAGYFKRS